MEAVAEYGTAPISTATGSPIVPPFTTAERGLNETSLQQSSSRPTYSAACSRQRNPEAPRSTTDPLTVTVPAMQARPTTTPFENNPMTTWQDSFVLPDVTKPPPGYPFHLEKAMELLHSWNLVDDAPGRHIIAFPSQVRLPSLTHNGTWSQPSTSNPALACQDFHVSPQGVFWYPQQHYYVPYDAGVTQSQPATTEQPNGEQRQFNDATYNQQNLLPVHQGQNWVPQPCYGAMGSNIEQDGPAALSRLQRGLRGQGAYNASTCTEPNQLTAASEQVWEPLQHFVTEDPNNEDWYAHQLQLDMQEQCYVSTGPGVPQGQPVLPTAFSWEPQQHIADEVGHTYQSVDSGVDSAVVPAVPESQCRWYGTSGIPSDAEAFDDGVPNDGRYHGRHTSGGYGFGSGHTNGVYAHPVTLWSRQGQSGSSIPNKHPKQGCHDECGCGADIDTRGSSTEARERRGLGRGRPSTNRRSGESIEPWEDNTRGLPWLPIFSEAMGLSTSTRLLMGFASHSSFDRMSVEEKVRRFLDSLPPVSFWMPSPPGNQPAPPGNQPAPPDNQPAPGNPPARPVDNILRPEHFADYGSWDAHGARHHGDVAGRGIRRGSSRRGAISSSSSGSPTERPGGWSARPNNRLDGPNTSTDAQNGSSS